MKRYKVVKNVSECSRQNRIFHTLTSHQLENVSCRLFFSHRRTNYRFKYIKVLNSRM
jgi:hypothetical protein